MEDDLEQGKNTKLYRTLIPKLNMAGVLDKTCRATKVYGLSRWFIYYSCRYV